MAQDLHLGDSHSNCKRTDQLVQVAWEEYPLHDSTSPPRIQPDHQMRIRLPWKEKQHAQNLEISKRRPFMVDICTTQFPASRRPYMVYVYVYMYIYIYIHMYQNLWKLLQKFYFVNLDCVAFVVHTMIYIIQSCSLCCLYFAEFFSHILFDPG